MFQDKLLRLVYECIDLNEKVYKRELPIYKYQEELYKIVYEYNKEIVEEKVGESRLENYKELKNVIQIDETDWQHPVVIVGNGHKIDIDIKNEKDLNFFMSMYYVVRMAQYAPNKYDKK